MGSILGPQAATDTGTASIPKEHLSKAVIRKYSPEDRAAVRRICYDTGLMGDPIDPYFGCFDLFKHHLRDSVAPFYNVGLFAEIAKNYAYQTSEIRVNGTGRIYNRYPVLKRQTASGPYLGFVSFGY